VISIDYFVNGGRGSISRRFLFSVLTFGSIFPARSNCAILLAGYKLAIANSPCHPSATHDLSFPIIRGSQDHWTQRPVRSIEVSRVASGGLVPISLAAFAEPLSLQSQVAIIQVTSQSCE
jgi:hypothetical protein